MSTDFAADDTVTVTGYRGYGQVDLITRTGVTVTFVRTIGRDLRTTTVEVAADRVALVRKGNRDLDMTNYLDAGHDLDTAIRRADADHRRAMAAYRARAAA